MQYIIDPPEVAVVPVVGETAMFPVRRIWCVGRNYADHAREMGHDPDREPPFFFSKPANTIVRDGSELPFPVQTNDLHHEVELVVALAKGGSNILVQDALDLVFGYAVGFDMTLRDVQGEAKKQGRPWTLSKGFDRSCPISSIAPVSRTGHPAQGRIEATIDGKTQQSGDLDQMIWSVAECLAHLSKAVKLLPGDLLMTGTPAGVSRVLPGNTLRGTCAGIGEITVTYRT
ncbi:fumarylacetoacetate hydrolase family protein [Methylobacterium frigidaeris]|uniref:Fumarylpyruvate hydrolase n=1 Tax=Methylobacterium frigidaeris TaxID=2038277 RepID=A0AA37HK09_9HYPH|nr:fumarylacetoacetate hydrolase family protein [Methylobacterium frigidaeris]GJD66936.1 Fumarylpyruvate hydrolase [Methylobacterium frigidaeris]